MTSNVTPTVQCTSSVTPTVQCTSGVTPTVQCKGPVHDLLLQQQKRLGKETMLAFFKGYNIEIENETEDKMTEGLLKCQFSYTPKFPGLQHVYVYPFKVV